jgi:hypothetical protein
MDSCEIYQINLSAMMDGELTGEALADTIRHLAGCKGCMKEFESFQSLQKRVNHELPAPNVPAKLWKTISRESGISVPTVTRRLNSPVMKVMRMAAVIMVCFGLGYALSKPVFHLQKPDPRSPIVLASSPGSMTEDRFLELTRELLTADPAYHRKMYLILSLLVDRFGDAGLQSLKESQTPATATPLLDGGRQVETYKF